MSARVALAVVRLLVLLSGLALVRAALALSGDPLATPGDLLVLLLGGSLGVVAILAAMRPASR